MTDVSLVFTDDELTEQALAADPDQPLPPDALPFGGRTDEHALLPAWYMPTPVRNTRKPWHVALCVLSIAGFLVINAAGLCITYGLLVIA